MRFQVIVTLDEPLVHNNERVIQWAASKNVKACYGTAPEGLRPLRVCGKLAWPTAAVKKLLGVTA